MMSTAANIRDKILPEIGDHMYLIGSSIATLKAEIELIKGIGFEGDSFVVQRQSLVKLHIGSRMILRTLRHIARRCRRDTVFDVLVAESNLPSYNPEFTTATIWKMVAHTLNGALYNTGEQRMSKALNEVLTPATLFADALQVQSSVCIGMQYAAIDTSELQTIENAFELLEEQVGMLWDLFMALHDTISTH
jgi:hypothetical protein